jgi:hypothetical protein
MFLLAATLARRDGIALSNDGLIWTKGAGGYGDGWRYTGQGISVRAGETVYIKYYATTANAALYFTEHGRKWGGWLTMGPQLIDGIGRSSLEPVVLRISKIGTPECTIAWVNGRGKSGIWSGMIAPGPYDLALHGEARWTLPPIVVSEAPKRQSFWAKLGGLFSPDPPPTGGGGGGGTHSVPDGGATAGLLAFALLTLALVRRLRG